MLERYTNAFSPAEAAPLTVQLLTVRIGTGEAAAPMEETFIYNPTTMSSGIILSYPVAPGTLVAVFLNGLRMVTRPEGGTGGDVAVAEDVGGGAPTAIITFVGDAYAVSNADVVHVKYWTPA